MFRKLTSIVIVINFFLAYLHQKLGGLLIQLEQSVVRNSEVGGSMVDASALIPMGLYAFGVTLVFAILNKGVLWSYLGNLLFFYLVLLLTNMDVSIIQSIQHGDYVLLAAILLAHVPLLIHLTSGLSHGTPQSGAP